MPMAQHIPLVDPAYVRELETSVGFAPTTTGCPVVGKYEYLTSYKVGRYLWRARVTECGVSFQDELAYGLTERSARQRVMRKWNRALAYV
jgi:hypothetical protein